MVDGGDRSLDYDFRRGTRTAATWEAFDPLRYSFGSAELANMQDASGNRRVGEFGGRE